MYDVYSSSYSCIKFNSAEVRADVGRLNQSEAFRVCVSIRVRTGLDGIRVGVSLKLVRLYDDIHDTFVHYGSMYINIESLRLLIVETLWVLGRQPPTQEIPMY